MEATYLPIPDLLVWEAFRKAFCKKFILNHIWVQKLTEFEQLIEGAMTVHQYEFRFNQLSRFVGPLIAAPKVRIRHFIRGLKPHIRNDVLAIKLLTFEENMKKTFFSKHMHRQIRTDKARDQSRLSE